MLGVVLEGEGALGVKENVPVDFRGWLAGVVAGLFADLGISSRGGGWKTSDFRGGWGC